MFKLVLEKAEEPETMLPNGSGASLMAQWVNNPPAMQETQESQVLSLGWEDPLKKEMAIHSSILAWMQTEALSSEPFNG